MSDLPQTKTERICAGEYVVRLAGADFRPSRGVTVSRVYYPNDGWYWIAAAEWDRWLYTDPLYTKRDAVFNARHMLAEMEAA